MVVAKKRNSTFYADPYWLVGFQLMNSRFHVSAAALQQTLVSSVDS